MSWLAVRSKSLGACISGVSAVEFAMLFPVFMVIVFGIVMFGSYLAMMNGVQQLAAEAARSSVAGLSDAERSTLAQAFVSANAATYPLISPNGLTVTAVRSGAGGNVVVVTVTYDASGSFIYALPSFIPRPPPSIVRSAAIRFGGF